MQSINQTYLIQSPIEKVWDAFTNAQSIQQWSGKPAVMSEELSNFSLWDGDCYGTTTQVIPLQLLRQDFYADKSWEQPSQVTFTFTPQGNVTRVDLMQENVPDDQVELLASGWEQYYMNPLKAFAEKNS